jgi:hypothetical protein
MTDRFRCDHVSNNSHCSFFLVDRTWTLNRCWGHYCHYCCRYIGWLLIRTNRRWNLAWFTCIINHNGLIIKKACNFDRFNRLKLIASESRMDLNIENGILSVLFCSVLSVCLSTIKPITKNNKHVSFYFSLLTMLSALFKIESNRTLIIIQRNPLTTNKLFIVDSI